MNYAQALSWVHGLPRLAPKANLNRMRQLMRLLENPQDEMDFVHVAGTNGKGSTVIMLAAVLAVAGVQVGANISPFVLDFCERFQVNGQIAPQEKVAEVLSTVRTAAEQMDESPLEFEAVTAAAFLYFNREKCSIVCLETGIGGSLDSTNIIRSPKVACITRIGMDHMEILGNTLEEIAAQKCGIIKAGCAVVSYPKQAPAVAEVIASTAKAKGCKLYLPQVRDLHSAPAKYFENKMVYQGKNYTLRLQGVHQQLNALVVIEAVQALRKQGFAITDEHVAQGLASAHIPARIEVMSHSPLLILDGSHNEDSGEALAQELKRQNISGLTAIVGMLHGKQAQSYLRLISPHVARLYAVSPDSPRAISASGLAEQARLFVSQVIECKSLSDAIGRLGNAENVLVSGSLYLASEARPLLMKMVDGRTKRAPECL